MTDKQTQAEIKALHDAIAAHKLQQKAAAAPEGAASA